jgi:methylglutaconyl-CoA hydratase
MTTTLDIATNGAVARVFLNRPEVRNAFSDAVIAELTATFQTLGGDSSVRAIVLGGHGKAFCAGADLNWMRAMADYSWEQNRADAQTLADMLWAIYSCVLVAAEGIQFCLSEARLGLLPATIGPYVVRALGEQAARRYFATAERFSSAEAHRLGFVHELAAADALDAKVDAIVQALVANGPAAVKGCKRLVQDLAGQPITAALREDTARRIADIRASAEGREGVQAFLQKRTPSWP